MKQHIVCLWLIVVFIVVLYGLDLVNLRMDVNVLEHQLQSHVERGEERQKPNE